MRLKNIIFVFAIASFTLVGCKPSAEKAETSSEVLAENKQNVALNISGMTCEIGCAKYIQSKLYKEEGVLNANVVFTDSIATIEFDANKTSKENLIAMVDGLADGKLYKASETTNIAHKCDENCKEKCELASTKMNCKEDCKMECCKDKKA